MFPFLFHSDNAGTASIHPSAGRLLDPDSRVGRQPLFDSASIGAWTPPRHERPWPPGRAPSPPIRSPPTGTCGRSSGRSLEPDRLAALEIRASAFARQVTSVVGPAAARYEHRLHLPELARYDAIGTRTESVVFDPAYDEAAAAVWASGLVALSGSPGSAYEQATLLYLLSLEGEAGQACPATCTIGLARALRRAADPGVRDRFLPALVDPVHATAARGSQFLTEVQGGSDVGANVCRAEPSGDGETFRISGEKWFCSVADADQFFLTARVAGGPDGTRGLGSFVVPRLVDGAPNGFTLRRLKEKLGTRGPGLGGDRLRRSPGLADRPGGARIPHRSGDRAQHQPLDDRGGQRRHDATGRAGGGVLRPTPSGVRATHR